MFVCICGAGRGLGGKHKAMETQLVPPGMEGNAVPTPKPECPRQILKIFKDRKLNPSKELGFFLCSQLPLQVTHTVWTLAWGKKNVKAAVHPATWIVIHKGPVLGSKHGVQN